MAAEQRHRESRFLAEAMQQSKAIGQLADLAGQAPNDETLLENLQTRAARIADQSSALGFDELHRCAQPLAEGLGDILAGRPALDMEELQVQCQMLLFMIQECYKNFHKPSGWQ